ncbi:MAG: hypothetical protein U5K33_00960 [Halofilum sp. (in: g-proteobacteria)]|nr:hypothetical protein [Halofilum sp. (in: g-proteobacteria)]
MSEAKPGTIKPTAPKHAEFRFAQPSLRNYGRFQRFNGEARTAKLLKPFDGKIIRVYSWFPSPGHLAVD